MAGITAALGAVQIATIIGTPMAKGGTVPPGYPRDTFPAMLTTGEEVLTEQQSRAGGQMNIKITTDITRGEDIHWVVQQVERRHESSY